MTVTEASDASVAVVGAGVAGAGVAHALRDAPVDVLVLERDAVGGRTATRSRDGCVYDYGANYVTADDDRVADVVRSLDEGDLVDVDEPVWTFDADGRIEPGDEARADAHKWTFEGGIGTLPRRLLERSGATVRTGTTVAALERPTDDGERRPRDGTGASDRWLVRTDEGTVGPVDAVVLTPPAPETAAILERSSVDGSGVATRFDRVAAAARAVPFRNVHSFALHYPFAVDRPYYALVDTDREHPVGWVAREECKRGHVPEGETLLVAQMSPGWSDEHADREDAVDEAAAAVARLLEDDRLASPDWTDGKRWRPALPDDGIGEAAEALAADGVHVAGDWVPGSARIHAALSTGLAVGDRLRGLE